MTPTREKTGAGSVSIRKLTLTDFRNYSSLSLELEPGMVYTAEPGLYIAAAADVPARFADIGIRIEDDVLITRDGCEVLTHDTPKSIDDIEALMRDGAAGRARPAVAVGR